MLTGTTEQIGSSVAEMPLLSGSLTLLACLQSTHHQQVNAGAAYQPGRLQFLAIISLLLVTLTSLGPAVSCSTSKRHC